jgi:hypothetical protein
VNLILYEKEKSASFGRGLTFLELFLKVEIACKTLDRYFNVKLTNASFIALKGHVKDATSCLEEMTKKSPSPLELQAPFFQDLSPQGFSAIYKARIQLAEAKIMLFNSQPKEAEVFCDQAIELVKARVESANKKVEYLTPFCDILHSFGMMEKKKSLLEYIYCVITETSGPADPRVSRILHNLSNTVINSGDLEAAELYSRTALENITSHSDMKDLRILVGSKISLGRVLLERCRAMCNQRDGVTGSTPSGSDVAEPSALKAMIDEAGVEFRSAVAFCDAEGPNGEPHLCTALFYINQYYLMRGLSGEDVEESMWRAVRLDPELYHRRYTLPSFRYVCSILQAAMRCYCLYGTNI